MVSGKVEELVKGEVKRTFNHEFLNRLDEIILFLALSEADMIQILELMVTQLNTNLAQKSITISVDEDAKKWILEKTVGDRSYGARPLRLALQRYIEDPLSEALIGGLIMDRPAFLDVYIMNPSRSTIRSGRSTTPSSPRTSRATPSACSTAARASPLSSWCSPLTISRPASMAAKMCARNSAGSAPPCGATPTSNAVGVKCSADPTSATIGARHPRCGNTSETRLPSKARSTTATISSRPYCITPCAVFAWRSFKKPSVKIA